MVRAGKRVALYCRVSTKDKGQTTENQRRALEQWAANAGCTVVATFEDKVSGAKRRDKRRSLMRCSRRLSVASST